MYSTDNIKQKVCQILPMFAIMAFAFIKHIIWFQGFALKLKNLLQKPPSPFFNVVWDPPHWVNLSIEDVMDGKLGNSKAFMKRLIDRSCTIHKIFQRGKSLAEARNNAKEMKSSLQLTSRTCATQFSTSQVNEFKKLMSSLHVYIATLYRLI